MVVLVIFCMIDSKFYFQKTTIYDHVGRILPENDHGRRFYWSFQWLLDTPPLME
jgi:hypothetical protein